MSEPAPVPQESNAEPVQTTKPHPFTLKVLLVAQCLLLLLLAFGGFSGWRLWQQYDHLNKQETQQKAQLSTLQTQLKAHQNMLQALQNQQDGSGLLARFDNQQSQLEQLEQQQDKQQNAYQQLHRQLIDISDQHAWQLNEALYQMRLAHLRLIVMQDIDSARLLLKNADERLIARQDPASFATRKHLAEALRRLERLSQLDRSALYLKLAALSHEAATLNRSLPVFTPEEAANTPDTASYWEKWRHAVSRYIRVDFDASADNIRPLLAGQNLNQARQALILALEQAQWAVLHGQQSVYSQALEQADAVLTLAFNPQDASTASLQNAINNLRTQKIAPDMPDLAPLLTAMQSYMHQRQQAAAPSDEPQEPAP